MGRKHKINTMLFRQVSITTTLLMGVTLLPDDKIDNPCVAQQQNISELLTTSAHEHTEAVKF